MGRIQELKQVDDFLDNCRDNKNLKKLLITGSKGSGKTSLLNMIKLKANKNYIIINISHLNNSDNVKQLLEECFENVKNAAPIKNAIPGIDKLKEFKIRDLNIKIPQFFNVGIEHEQNTVFLKSLQRKFNELQKRAGKPIILLCDDCNIIAENEKVLFEINNFFVELNGYDLIFCGTKDNNLNKIMNAFAPLMNIELMNFSYEETKEAISRPLRTLTTNDEPLINSKSVCEIYFITKGHPSIVNLFCHYMYHEYDELKSPTIGLTKNVYTNVKDQLSALCLETDISKKTDILLTHKINSICENMLEYELIDKLETFVNEYLRWIEPKLIESLKSGGDGDSVRKN